MSERMDFWARRKAAVKAEEEAQIQAAEDQVIAADRAALEEKSDDEILAELDLPDPDTLKPGDDIRGFMGQAVPDRLRRRALRQLWKLNPVLANVDGLVDYGEDFTDAALVVENLQTAYQVGKGMMAHVEEMARQAEAKEAADAVPEAGLEELELSEEASENTEQFQPEPDTTEDAPPRATQMDDFPEPQTQENQSDTRYAAAPKRRMRFAFDD